MELIFATNNNNKVEEIKLICPPNVTILSLQDVGINTTIEEPYFTLEENAREKCSVIHQITGKSCFSEDSGLFIEALNGAPGVHSARFAGKDSNAEQNIQLVLTQMGGILHRAAYFKTVICMFENSNYTYFEGICEGQITLQKKGNGGFGYDPIFIPNGFEVSFGEMDKQLKVNISHRKKAFDKFIIFLLQNIHQKQ